MEWIVLNYPWRSRRRQLQSFVHHSDIRILSVASELYAHATLHQRLVKLPVLDEGDSLVGMLTDCASG